MGNPFGQFIKIPDDRNFFVTSDQHFYHKNIISYCNRPFKDWCEMNTVMTEAWFDKVKKDDIVFHLGDVFCGCGVVGVSTEQAITFWNSLPGKKILIKGNHDERLVGKVPMFVDGGDEINKKDYLVVRWQGWDFYMCHRPLHDWKEMFTWDNKKAMLYGHRHESLLPDSSSNSVYNVCVDVNDWAPVNSNRILDELDFTIPF